MNKNLYTYKLNEKTAPNDYDEAMAVACIQGIYNRFHPEIYILSDKDTPAYWLEHFTKPGGWLSDRKIINIDTLDELFAMAKNMIKGAVIWDTNVPATVNAATTVAGVEDLVVMSPEFADKYIGKWELEVKLDLRGKFDGKITGSVKNDVYIWVRDNYLSKGKCSAHWICLYEDSFDMRVDGNDETKNRSNIRYVVTRDWSISKRAFVFDLSPWGDEVPFDDPGQPLGTDKATYISILEAQLKRTAGQQMTELAGFFNFEKYSNVGRNISKHDPVPTEWESVFLMSPYNCYQNTVAHDCYNQSLHSTLNLKQLKQHRPKHIPEIKNKVYLCFQMCDYDSTTPLYEFFPKLWNDPNRGKIPLGWGINPNLIETYPDIIEDAYKNATDNDFFVADASAAGYFNPNRIKPEYWDMVINHNKHFYNATDMSLSPMVLDWDPPTKATLDAFSVFSPDGYSTIIMPLHVNQDNYASQEPLSPKLHNGMPVDIMINDICNWSSATELASVLTNNILSADTQDRPYFHYIRVVWIDPTRVLQLFDEIEKQNPSLNIQLVNPYTYFAMLKKHLQENK